MTLLKTPELILDPLQREAAETPEGPLLIMGGPGTGKTHTMQARAALLLKGGASPHSIAFLTFSARGAEDIRQQMEQHPMTADHAQHIFIGTMHHYASCFLRRAGAQVLGISPHFTIWDRDQAKEVIAMAMTKYTDEGEKISLREVDDILDWNTKVQTTSPEEAEPPRFGRWLRILEEYRAEKRQQGTLDLDDLIPLAILAMEKQPEIRAVWNRTRTRHLLVDEFQDITPRQYQLLTYMTGPTRSVTIAADPNQSINRWRGSNPRMIEQFRLDHNAHIQTKLLKVNHRGTRTLCEVAKRLTDEPEMQGLIHDYQSALRIAGPPPALNIFQDHPEAMYKYIIDAAEDLVRQGWRWEDLACVYRSGKTINMMKGQLNKRSIPYSILGEIESGKNSNTRCITALLALALNPMDLRAFSLAAAVERRNKDRRLNPEITKKVARIARERRINLIEASKVCLDDLRPGMQAHQNLRYTIGAWNEITGMLTDPDMQIHDICRRAEGLLTLAQHAESRPVQEPQILKFLTLSQTTPRMGQEGNREFLARFLEMMAAATQPEHRGLENDDPFAHHQGMTFATIHQSKGMQWKVVWVADASDESMPGVNWDQDPERDLEEERIFYVATTRATDQLHYCYATGLGSNESESQRCRFLTHLDGMLQETEFPQGALNGQRKTWLNLTPEEEPEPEPEPELEPEMG